MTAPKPRKSQPVRRTILQHHLMTYQYLLLNLLQYLNLYLRIP
ncbi:hypothetical protein BVRB_3g050410 [Beta vulgaris subsp. vulgaris]|uniref:Uncharacterized protein n=1 Tax=Beta vulgaris subsp. vulgaris TaxID=3555 RepID=A0A0J8CWS4_BETVV|nr:hypothetical protein BVRB_3g050410 [Beta vulgaris subsp. vulgaris]